MQILPCHMLAERLHARGYVESASPDIREMWLAVRAFQADHGLEVDGWAGPQTSRALLDPLSHFCGVVERLASTRRVCRWPHKRLAWTMAGRLSHIAEPDQKDAFALAWRYWSEVCGIEPVYTANARTAHVVMGAGGIDQAGGTLAWSELPCGPTRQLQQKYDSRETWVVAEQPGRREIDLVRVAAHEIGHVLGIPHLSEGALMAPAYSSTIRRPQAADIREAVLRYGPPAEPAPAAEPPPPAAGQLTLDVNGRRYTWPATETEAPRAEPRA